MLNDATNRVANGRRLMARRIVMNSLATVPVQIWRKRVVYNNPQNNTAPKDLLSYEALQLSKQDEPDYEYDYVSMASLLMDCRFGGGYIHVNNSLNNPSAETILAQIELYDEDLPKQEQMLTTPEGVLQEGDLVALGVYANFMLWYEIVGITGQSMMADFGAKYILNRRDELQLNPIKSEVETRP